MQNKLLATWQAASPGMLARNQTTRMLVGPKVVRDLIENQCRARGPCGFNPPARIPATALARAAPFAPQPPPTSAPAWQQRTRQNRQSPSLPSPPKPSRARSGTQVYELPWPSPPLGSSLRRGSDRISALVSDAVQSGAEAPSSSRVRKAGRMWFAHSSYPSALGWKPSCEKSLVRPGRASRLKEYRSTRVR